MESDSDSVLEGGKARGRWARLARRRLPVLRWAARYCRAAAAADLVAGLTLGLTLVPQSIAYAALAGLPVHYGLYSSFMGTILYVFFGTVKEVSIGPTSLMALLTLQATRDLPLEAVPLLALLSGLAVTAMGLLRLGFLVELISPAVTSGFTTSTALVIVASQLRALLGLGGAPHDAAAWQLAWRALADLPQARLPDAALGAACCVLLLALRKLKDVKVPAGRAALRRGVWLASISRNALVVCGAASLAYVLHNPKDPMFTLSGRVEGGLPRWGLSLSAQAGNETLGAAQLAGRLGGAVLVLPLVMVIANIAIAKAFSGGRAVDATQEMLTLGLVNVAGALVHAMPTCGAFTRSAVSHASGVRTPAAGLYSGIVALLALMFLTEYFYFIPKASLAAVLICAVIFMIDVSIFGRLWRRDRAALGALCVTVGVALAWSVELAVPAGAAADLALLLARVARPPVLVRTSQVSPTQSVTVARVSLGCVFLSAEHVCGRLARAAPRAAPRALLVDLGGVALLDLAAIEALERLIKKFKSADKSLILYNAPPAQLALLEAALGAGALRARSERDALAAAALPAALPAAPPAAPPAAALPAPPAAPALHGSPEDIPLLITDSNKKPEDNV